MTKPRISIVTPSFNMLPYLELCALSVKDQEVPSEHIVMDGESTDGTVEWLKRNQSIVSVSEQDKGMYNALNKAIDKTEADIIGHLNCDEQYLPGVLKFVLAYFEEHPEVDFIAGDFMIIDEEGELLAFRKSFQLRWQYFFSNYLYTTTCTLFYRKKIFKNLRFDESYKSIADVIFVYQVMKAGFKGVHIPKYFSVFTYSGVNLSLAPISGIEKKRFNKTLPVWYRILKPIFFISFFVERIINGTYSEKSKLTYSIFNGKDLLQRTVKEKINPTYRLRFIYKEAE